VLKEDEIWSSAEEVWANLPSSKIASGFIQCHQIASKVISAQGDNKFVGNKTDNGIHCGIRKDFNETAMGLYRKDRKRINPPLAAVQQNAIV
jgi:hypothetical protein